MVLFVEHNEHFLSFVISWAMDSVNKGKYVVFYFVANRASEFYVRDRKEMWNWENSINWFFVLDGKRQPLLNWTGGTLGSMCLQRLRCMIVQGLFMSLGLSSIVLFLRLCHLASKHTILASIQKVKELPQFVQQINSRCWSDSIFLTHNHLDTCCCNPLVADKIYVYKETRYWGTDAAASP
jgi:hypothetical protein